MIDFATSVWDLLMNWLYNIIQLVFGWINIPSFPVELTNSIDSYLDLIFNNLSLLGFFIRPITLKIVVPILLIAINFELIYKIVIWLVRKLPFVSVH